ncbi:uncharacterized protein A4U43_C04F14380 [Asparagus officinalis]|uniref:Uncharacterized protein n=1 Tax=Asparagus officinalis TaxID=4686 RepID=A0A5P1F3I6_ASPOF|nr:uncharacterized protein A4U43_C04F14380 [Asparagus officinalis]
MVGKVRHCSLAGNTVHGPRSNSTAASWTVHTSLRLERIEEPRQGTTKSGTINQKISLSRSKSPSDGFTSKPVESANNAASSQVNDSVKETIKSSLKGQWKAPDQKSKISKNIRPSCIDEIEKRVVSSIEKRSH